MGKTAAEKAAEANRAKVDKVAKAAAKEAAKAAGAASRAHKGTLEQFQDHIGKSQKFVARAVLSLRTWNLQSDLTAPLQISLGNASTAAKEIEPRLMDLKKEFEALAAAGFVPSAAPRGPKFAVGEIVKVDDEWVSKYTKSGIYKAEELMMLEIVTIGDKEVLTKTAGGREVLIRASAHLETIGATAEV